MATTEAAGTRRICDNCRGNMAWDPQARQLKCDSCGALRDAPPPEAAAAAAGGMAGYGGGGAPAAMGNIVEYDLESALRDQKPKGRIGSGARQVKCGECMAVVEFPDNVQATKCDFCGSPSVLAQAARDDHYRPESLLPFGITRDGATVSFKKWQGKLWFRPNNLKEKSSVAELKGVYLPYWTFDAQVLSRWTADAGYHYYVDESYSTTENGRSVTKTRKVQKTRWEPCSGQRNDAYDDHLICASKGVPDNLDKGVRNYKTASLVAYAPEYLQGFSAESYAIELPDAWKSAQGEIGGMQERKCAKDVPGDTHRNLHANHQFSRATFKHVLLPLWIAAYRYDSKVYRFVVNGQTGDVSGTAPYSVTKIVLFIAAIIAVIVGVLVLKNR